MSFNCVSSTVTRNCVIPIDVKNSCFTERALPFCVIDRDTQPVLFAYSKLIRCHMKPKSWIGVADNHAPAFRTYSERSRADSLSEARFYSRPWNGSLSRACWIVLRKVEMSSCILESRSWKTLRLMLYTGRGIGEHPIIIGLRVALLESRILLEEQFQGYSRFSRCWASNFFRDLITELVGVWQRKEYTIFGAQCSGIGYLRRTEGHQGSPTFTKSTFFSLCFR